MTADRPDPCGASSATAEASTAEDAVTVGSLCSGYTGLEMGLALALGVPLRHAWHVENDPAPSKILAHHYPNVPNYGDLKTLDYALMQRVDILTAGYPCQPFSDAGLRKGADDPRHLWPYVADTIRALRPRNVLLENVAAHVRRGLDSVLADLAALGYDASWGVVRASDTGAPHRRQRMFVVASDASDERHERAGSSRYGRVGPAHSGPFAADASGDGRHEGRAEPAGQLGRPDAAQPRREAPADAAGAGRNRSARSDGQPDGGCELPGRALADGRDGERADWGVYEPAVQRWEWLTGRPAPRPTDPRGRGGAERLSPRLVEWMMGLPAGWVTDVPGLTPNEQLRALGNGVCPQQCALAVRLLTATAVAEAAA